jgi:acyl-CoA dehydrogenase
LRDRELREAVRAFLDEEIRAGSFRPAVDSWVQGHSPEFSRKLAARGWLGMTWPRRYGGHERSAYERFVVIEELLAAGAPVAAHWIADRQTGPLILRFGTERQREFFLPRIAAGTLFVAAGLSEPESGSDLASVRTRAERVRGGWSVTGRKIWTSHAHRSDWLLALVRTEPRDADAHAGLSQMFVDLAASGVQVRPIRTMDGTAHFAEVLLDGVQVPDEMVVGAVGAGWRQVRSELAYERSGPERYMSSFPLLVELLRQPGLGEGAVTEIGVVAARLWALRALSLRVQDLLAAGRSPDLEAALVKDIGTRLEQEIVEMSRTVAADLPGAPSARLRRLLDEGQLAAPTFTLRGGTVEILRSIIAKGLDSIVARGAEA